MPAQPASVEEYLLGFFSAREVAAYLVGGCVRDRLLGRASHDIDVAVEGDALRLGRELANRLGGAFYVLDAERGTARVLPPAGEDPVREVDVAQLKDADLLADLAARDFTVNAMALPVRDGATGDLIDPHGGWTDLREHRLRAVSPAAVRDDPIRILRAARLAHELCLDVDPALRVLLREAAPFLERVSAERVRDELCKILALSPAGPALSDLDDWGALRAILARYGEPVDDEGWSDRFTLALAVVSALEDLTPHPSLPDESAVRPLQGKGEIPPLPFRERDGVRVCPPAREAVPRVFHEALAPYRERLAMELAKVVVGQRSRGLLLKWVALLLNVESVGQVSIPAGPATAAMESRPTDSIPTLTDALTGLRFSKVEVRRARTMAALLNQLAKWAGQGDVSRAELCRFYNQPKDCGLEVILLYLASQAAAWIGGVGGHSPEVSACLAKAALHAYFDEYDSIVSPPKLVDGNMLVTHFKLARGPWIQELLDRVREAQAEGGVATREEALREAETWMKGKR